MVIEIPEQLKNKDFRFILLRNNSKLPVEDNWETTSNYYYEDEKLLEHIKNGGNYGVLAGPGNLRILDADDVEFSNKILDKLKTLKVQTCGGTYHFYVISKYDINHTFKEGEYRATKQYVVGPNCYAIDKKKKHEGWYKII